MSNIVAGTSSVSPFDDKGVQYAWDSTSLGLIKTCARKYQLSMILNWQPKQRSHHLTFGIAYHSALETYDKYMVEQEAAEDQLEAHEEGVRRAIQTALLQTIGYAPPEEDNRKTRYNLLRAIVWYLEQYGLNDNCKTVKLANGKAAVELSFRFSLTNDIVLCGHLDKIIEFGGNKFVLDRKTAGSTIGYYYYQKYSPDNQMSIYTLASQVVFDTHVKGVIIDAAQIAVGFSAFGRHLTHRNQAQLEEFVRGIESYRDLAAHYTRTGFWPMNETACGNFGGCQFRRVCSKSPRVRESLLRTNFTQEYEWNPLEAR